MNLALLPADLAANRVCSNPQTKTLSPDLTRHSHEATSRSITSTSSRMVLWGVSTMRLICARPGPFSSPEPHHNQTGSLPTIRRSPLNSDLERWRISGVAPFGPLSRCHVYTGMREPGSHSRVKMRISRPSGASDIQQGKCKPWSKISL
jgi:hypothetical protein